jgi:hypothetical protein
MRADNVVVFRKAITGNSCFDAGTYSVEIPQFGWYRFQVNLK